MASLTVYVVPTSGTAAWYKQTTSLNGTTYGLVFRYNTRLGVWCLDINNAAEQPIVQGIPLLTGRPLIGQYPELALPNGELLVVDNTGQGTNPGLASFLTDHVLLYGVTQ